MNYSTDVAFMINTYDRHESLSTLINCIHGIGTKINIYIVDDGSNPPIEQHSKKIKFNPYTHVYYQGNKGKPYYWETCNYLFDWLRKEKPYKFYYMLPDDVYFHGDFLEKTQAKWEELQAMDPNIVTLNLITDRINKETKEAVPCWTAFEPQRIDEQGVWQTQWVDMAFMTTHKFFDLLVKIPHIKRDWGNRPMLGSGVGSFISRNLVARKYNMYMPYESFTKFQTAHKLSVMNPKIEE